jgi:predicted MFS family arabinose efflux permease
MKKENVLVGLLALIQFTNIMDFMIMMPLGPQLMRLFSISPREFGIIVSSYTISAGLSGFFAAFLIDRFDRKTALMTLYTGFIIGTFVCGLAPSYTGLVAARILTGVFGGVLGALVMSIVSDAFPIEKRGSAMGLVMAGFALASVFGVPFGLFIATLYSWHWPFLFLAGFGVIILIILNFYMPSMRNHIRPGIRSATPLEILREIGSNTNQLLALLLMSCLVLGQFTVIPFISNYMVANVGFKESELTYIYLFGGIVSLVAGPIIGKLADRYGRYKVFIISVLLSGIPIFLITNMPRVPLHQALIVNGLFFLVMAGRMSPAMTIISSTVLPQRRGSFMSINSCVMQLSSGLASFASGVIMVKTATGEFENYHLVGYIAIFFSILCVLIVGNIKSAEAS